MDSRSDGTRHCSASILAVVRALTLIAPSSRAPGLGVQGQWIPRRRPLTPRPRHHLHRCSVAIVDRPLLWRKQRRRVEGNLSLLVS